MKICPACKTQYSDDTLRFCLQDGTPLDASLEGETPTVVLGETETVAARVGLPVNDPNPAAWQQSQVTHVATLGPQKKGPNTGIAVAVTAAGMLLLFGVIGIAALIYFQNSGLPPVQNSNNTANIPGGVVNTNYNTLPTPQMSPFEKPTQTRAAATPFPANSGDFATPPPIDDSEARSDVSRQVQNWKSMLESRNLNAYMGNYADTIDYFSKRNASVGTVRADKARAFSLYNSMQVNVSNMSVSVGPSGETATATFDKEWSFSGRDTSSGKVRSQLGFRKINGRWLITSEKDLKVYYKR